MRYLLIGVCLGCALYASLVWQFWTAGAFVLAATGLSKR